MASKSAGPSHAELDEPRVEDLKELQFTLGNVLLEKMLTDPNEEEINCGEEVSDEVEELGDQDSSDDDSNELLQEAAEDLSSWLAERIVSETGVQIYSRTRKLFNGNKHDAWTATTWIVAFWVLNNSDASANNPVQLKRFEDKEDCQQAWEDWIIGLETGYYIVKAGEHYRYSEKLRQVFDAGPQENDKFTLCWINVGTQGAKKHESHMVTVIGNTYYDTARLEDEEGGFHSVMQERRYARREFVSPYTNFCTVFSWFFMLKLPTSNKEGWEIAYIDDLFPPPPALPPPPVASALPPPPVASAVLALPPPPVASDEPSQPSPKRRRTQHGMLSIGRKMIQLRF